jgi:hypothetical protein
LGKSSGIVASEVTLKPLSTGRQIKSAGIGSFDQSACPAKDADTDLRYQARTRQKQALQTMERLIVSDRPGHGKRPRQDFPG